MPTLRWLTRDQDVRAAEKVPYRLLEEVPGLGHGDRDAGNMLIQGDNLEALKSLLPFYAGQVKCIYIDPPYNTGSAFKHYDDNLEHSQWLAMMWPRLELLRELLAEDGSIWVNLDDNEAHYFRVIGDEVFGRKNFVVDISWEKRYAPPPDTKDIGYVHDHLIVFRKGPDFIRNLLPLTEDQTGRYKNPDTDPRGPWKSENYTCRYNSDERPNLYYPIINPNTNTEVWPKKTRVWAMSKEVTEKNLAEKRIWWGKNGTNSVPALKNFIAGINQGMMPMSLWKHTLAGHNQEAKREVRALFGADAFSTPKPERLLSTILTIATNPGDLVLDSFLGSGTTAAVAQKMNRRFIGIEMGDHAVTHCQPRLVKVADGEQGGISKAQNWQGGGGFRFFKLGAAVFDETGGLQPDIRFATLAAHIWFSEMNAPWNPPETATPFLGALGGRGIALLYNGILGDKSVNGGNVLNRQTLRVIREAAGGFDGAMTIYGERTVLSDAVLEAENISFKQTPYDVRARK